MWLFLLSSVVELSVVKTAWVEIPQLPSDNKPQFFFGTPKVSLFEDKLSTTTPMNYKTLMITPLTTTPAEKVEETLTPPTIRKAEIEEPVSPPAVNFSTTNEDLTYSGFVPVLNNIQRTLTANAKKSLKSKISLLTNLRDDLLTNIDERMTNLWSSTEDFPEARGYHDHEMDFPSNEGALMTIGFLTFAVFLIKLVLKLIHALKEKHQTMAATTTTTTIMGRKRRDLHEYNSLKILQLIDEYNFN